MTDKLLDDLTRALGGAYTIERELTGGGMSRVFVAKEHALGREVVIKVLPHDLAAGVNRDRFRREVQLAARLSHPYIVPLHSAGEHGELLWFTMPYIAGESLRTRLQRVGPLPFDDVLRMLRDVVEALAYAHSRGVVHRDIKPGNILADGHHALVTDFGVAKALSAALPTIGPGHTTSGMAIGTPTYMAPEQLAADPAADHRVDIYAVGLLAYELLSGASPFAAPSPTATMAAQLTRIPTPLHPTLSEVPEAFSALIQRCLAKSPDDRPADARAVLTELDLISGALAAHAHRGGGAMAPRAASLPVILAAAGVLGLVAVGVWYSTSGARAGDAAGNVQRDSVPDTVFVMGGRDSSEGTTLPAKPMTHADSLRIAEALRDELEQLQPKATVTRVRPVVRETTTVLAPVDISTTDSLVRARIIEMYGRLPMPPGDRGNAGRGGARAFNGGGDNRGAMLQGSGPPQSKRLVLVQMPPGGRNPDPALVAFSDSAAVQLASRLKMARGWDLNIPDFRRAPPPESLLVNTDVSVTIGVRETNDSAYLRVTIREVTRGSGLNYQVISSKPVAKPTNMQPFEETLREVTGLLERIKRLNPGQPWAWESRRPGSGPNDQMFRGGPTGNDFRKLDSMRNAARNRRGGTGN